jgi:hypothetical protein
VTFVSEVCPAGHPIWRYTKKIPPAAAESTGATQLVDRPPPAR